MVFVLKNQNKELYNLEAQYFVRKVFCFYSQADVEEDKIQQFEKLKELPPMQLRQVCWKKANQSGHIE